MLRTPLLILVSTLTLSAAASTAQQAESSGVHSEGGGAAVLIAEGTVAQGQVVAAGRDLVVAGRAMRGAVAVGGSVTVRGEVQGDVVAVGGDVRLEPGSRVSGDAFVLGGRLIASPGSVLAGRGAAYPTASTAWLVLAEGPVVGLSPFSRAVLGAKVGLIAGWILTLLALLWVAAPALGRTARSVGEEPLLCFGIGLVAVLVMILAAALASAFLGVMIGVPLILLAVLLALFTKLWGMVAVFSWLGSRVRRRWSVGLGALLQEALIGLAILAPLKFVPWVGTWVWSAATLIGIGASLRTRFGRGEGWLEGV